MDEGLGVLKGARCPRLFLISMAVGGAILASPMPAGAHDFWIEPSRFNPSVGTEIGLGLRVGVNLEGEPIPRDPAHIRRFVMVGPEGASDVPGFFGADPAGYIRPASPGVYLVAYESFPTRIELPGEIFEKYLSEEGLEFATQLRAERLQTPFPATERFSRCAKCLIRCGSIDTGPYRHAFGMTLELIPEANPCLLAPGQNFSCRLLYRGKPLAGALVAALSREEGFVRLSERSDEEGRASFILPHAGFWLIKAVHILEREGEDVEWESYWASLTFELGNSDPTSQSDP